MNKEAFLKELQARIRVLADSEQQDILGEYAQHIDLQIHEGASEDAATGDFGDLDELAAEILEAYHVKAAFAEPPAPVAERRKLTLPDPRPGLKRGWANITGAFRRAGRAIVGFFRRGWAKCKALFARGSHKERPKKEKKERSMMENNPSPHAFGAALGRFGRSLGGLLRRLLWLTWNVAVVLASLPFAALALAALICLGTLAVLLVQGYPLAGATLCCLGGLCCAAALFVLIVSLFHRRKPAAPAAEPCLPVETALEVRDA